MIAKIDLRMGDYKEVLQDVKADLIFTSPPYNIGSRAARKDGYRRIGQYDPKSYGGITDYPDTLPEAEYQAQQTEFLIWCAKHLKRNGVVVYNHKPRRNGHLIHPGEWFLRGKVRRVLVMMEEIIWDRGSTHNHCPQLMWPTTERLYVFSRPGGKYPLRNRQSLPFRSDLWRLYRAPANGHNAPFPLELAEAVILAWCPPGGVVCDPYSGSGTTALAAKRLNRNFVGSEVLEKYFELAKEKIQ